MESTIIHGDFLEEYDMVGQFDLVFADPPFNIGQDYKDFIDKNLEYKAWTREWLAKAWSITRGVMAVHGPNELAMDYVCFAREWRIEPIAWIQLYQGFGQNQWGNWPVTNLHCLVFSKNGTHAWNHKPVLVESVRKRTGDKRIEDSPEGGMRLPGSVWGVDEPYFGKVQGNNAEKWPEHPNQLPQAYLRRLILAYTNSGDRVFDPFVGTGTTGQVCRHEGRRFVGTDISKTNCESARKRIDTGFYRFESVEQGRKPKKKKEQPAGGKKESRKETPAGGKAKKKAAKKKTAKEPASSPGKKRRRHPATLAWSTKTARDEASRTLQKLRRMEEADRHGYCTCVSCGAVKKWNRGMQGGHFIGGRTSGVLFEEVGINPQCEHCNKWANSSNAQTNYHHWMLERHGMSVIKKLKRLRHKTIKRTKEDYLILRDGYMERIKILAKEDRFR